MLVDILVCIDRFFPKTFFASLCIHNDKIMYTTSHTLYFNETNLDKNNKTEIVL